MGMLQVAFRRVRPEKAGVLREWMAELNDRRDEVLETFEAETTRHEKVFLLDADGPGPLMVYVMDVDDPQHAAAAFADSRLPIDVRHKEVMAEVDAGRAEVESLLDISADREAS